MSTIFLLLISSLAGLVIGAFAFANLNVGLWSLFVRPREAVYGFTVQEMLVFCIGGILGMGTALAAALVSLGHREQAAWVCLGFGCAMPLFLFICLLRFILLQRRDTRDEDAPPVTIEDRKQHTPSWVGGASVTILALLTPTLLWVLGLMWAGIHLHSRL